MDTNILSDKKTGLFLSSHLKTPNNSKITATQLCNIHALLVTVSRGSNSLRHWSSINDSHSWIINISGSLGLFLSGRASVFILPVSSSSLTLPFIVNSPGSRTVSHNNSQHFLLLQHQFISQYPEDVHMDFSFTAIRLPKCTCLYFTCTASAAVTFHDWPWVKEKPL